MVIAIVLCSSLSFGLVCHTLLLRRQRQNQRSRARTELLGTHDASVGRASHERSALQGEQLPVIGRLLRKQRVLQRDHRREAELPRMLDILAMGMHAGLSFDAAFGLYVHRFDTELAVFCRERFEVWERGLISRNDGLKQLAEQLNMPLFTRFSGAACRSLRYGIPLAPLTKEYAAQARTEYRNKQKEQVLKAPVKMLLPTGTLILPAMMMLVVGPIVLDVTERMV